jgi:multicomponent Na+:H+ antiporter subunit D
MALRSAQTLPGNGGRSTDDAEKRDMNPATALPATVLLPLAASALIAAAHRRPNLREAVTLLTGIALLALVVSQLEDVLNGARPAVILLEMLPGLSIEFEIEPLGMLFALVASSLWIVTSLYSIGYMRGHHELNQTRFYCFFAIAISSAMGIAFAGNLLTLFIFYELLTLSTYPLVTHAGTEQAREGGRVYLGYLLGSSVAFLLLALVWTWKLAGTLDFRDGGILDGVASPAIASALLVLFIFGIGKAAVMPIHRWLPAAMVAPTPVSALLHAVAVVKAGVFSVLKVAVYIFGLDYLASIPATQWLLYVAAATILIASLVALKQDNLKLRLAYSTVGQLSYIVMGALLATPQAAIGGSMHIAMHAFGKITLFFCAGAILVGAHKTAVSELDGLGRRMPFTFGAFLLGSFSIIGLPPMGGSWSKWFLMMGAADASRWPMMAVLMVSSLLSIAYLMPVVVRGFFGTAPAGGGGNPGHGDGGIQEAPLLCVLPPVVTAIGGIVLFFCAERVWNLLAGMVP